MIVPNYINGTVCKCILNIDYDKNRLIYTSIIRLPGSPFAAFHHILTTMHTVPPNHLQSRASWIGVRMPPQKKEKLASGLGFGRCKGSWRSLKTYPRWTCFNIAVAILKRLKTVYPPKKNIRDSNIQTLSPRNTSTFSAKWRFFGVFLCHPTW